ncbi:SH3 domain-containing protein [Exiguobacterium antarcticum]|uniref:SH3 domain-containing protein n=1 Tax=Exiguobacterium antarcticum TaxID=132920 RepID=A0ABT6R539_9BACL|nr:SH3 domain-containing protein [Exiguobacterium antarcticum]MDI3236078.1 SH3 domain-containing protein [Exiguobacterium antarcticum]
MKKAVFAAGLAATALSVGFAQETEAASETVTVNTAVLNVRTAPTTASADVGNVYKGQKLNVEGRSGAWIQTNINGQKRYVHGTYTSAGSSFDFKKATVTTAVLNVRSQPTTNSKDVGNLYKGQSVNVESKVGAWIKTTIDGKTRYVHSAYTTLAGSTAKAAPAVKAAPVAKPAPKAAAKPATATKQTTIAAKSGTKVTMNVTAYTNDPSNNGSQLYNGRALTASGYDVTNTITYNGMRIVAASAQYPIGTRMHISGIGEAIVLDRGGAIQGNKLDLLVGSQQEALNWGRQNVTVTVY